MFVLQNAPMTVLKLGNLNVEPIGLENEISKFDLTLDFAEVGDKLVGYFEYNADLFHEATVERLASHFKTLIQGIIQNPN